MGKKSLIKIFFIAAVVLLIFVPPFARYQELRYKNAMLDRKKAELKNEIKRLS